MTGLRSLALAAAAVLAATALAGLLSSCTAATFNWTGAGPVSNPPDSPGSTAGPVVSATRGGRVPPESVPPYFLELTGPAGTAAPAGLPAAAGRHGPRQLHWAGPSGGPPGNPGRFTFVTAGTSDGRTFLVGAQPWDPARFGTDDSNAPVSFYLLRFDPAAGARDSPRCRCLPRRWPRAPASSRPGCPRMAPAWQSPSRGTGTCSTCTCTRCRRAAAGRPGQ